MTGLSRAAEAGKSDHTILGLVRYNGVEFEKVEIRGARLAIALCGLKTYMPYDRYQVLGSPNTIPGGRWANIRTDLNANVWALTQSTLRSDGAI